MNTIAQGVAEIKLGLSALAMIPTAAINAALAVIEAEVPVYTGTYEGAIHAELENPLDCRVFISPETLLESAIAHSDLFAVRAIPKDLDPLEYITFAPPSDHPSVPYGLGPADELYPLRIERSGSPAYYEGENMWLNATAAAEAAIKALLAAVRP